MKKIFFMAAAASLMLTALSCSEDKTQDQLTPKPPIDNPEGPLETLTATVEQQDDAEVVQPKQADTRTTLSGTNVIWTAGEKIRVFNKANTAQSGEYTLKTGEGTANATFEGTAIPGQKYAFYPTSAYTGISDGTIAFTLPATQVYRANSFADGANPMVGQSDAAGTIQFKNLCGAIKLKLTGTATITQIVMTVPDGKVAGTATVDAAAATPAAEFSDAASKTVTLSVPNVTLSATATNFYLVVPNGTYPAGVTFAISDSDGYTVTITTKSAINVNRSKVAPLAQLAYARPIAFPDPYFRLVLTQNYGFKATADGTDININDAGNKALFSATPTIECPQGYIISLKGIEYFTALTSLTANDNQLTTLDFSKNNKLTYLNVNSNQLSSLTPGSQPNLTTLACGNNRLTSLDFSSMKSVKTLLCCRNRISTLDISMLPITAFTAYSPGLGNHTDASGNATTITVYMTAVQKAAWTAAGTLNTLYNGRITAVQK